MFRIIAAVMFVLSLMITGCMSVGDVKQEVVLKTFEARTVRITWVPNNRLCKQALGLPEYMNNTGCAEVPSIDIRDADHGRCAVHMREPGENRGMLVIMGEEFLHCFAGELHEGTHALGDAKPVVGAVSAVGGSDGMAALPKTIASIAKVASITWVRDGQCDDGGCVRIDVPGQCIVHAREPESLQDYAGLIVLARRMRSCFGSPMQQAGL